MEELTNVPVSRRIEQQLVRKILAVVALFFCCQIIFVCIDAFVPRTLLTNAVADVFAVLNCSMNITIYCGFDREFRKEFKNIVCCCFNRNRDKTKTILSSVTVVKYSAESQPLSI